VKYKKYPCVIFCFTLWLNACTTIPASHTLPETQYIDRVINKIEIIGEARYPKLASHIPQACTIEVVIHITHGGTLLGAHVMQSSCHTDIDKLMLELIYYSPPYPPMPDLISQESLIFNKRWSFMPIK